MATPLNQYNPVTGKREKIGGWAFQKATTPTLNKQMSDFSKSQWATTNTAWEWTNIPTQEQVSAFNKQFSTKTPIDMNVGENTGNVVWPYWFSSRQEPTVATPENPVVSKTMTDNLEYDPNNPEDYLMRLQSRISTTGVKPNETEYYNMLQAQKAMQQSQLQTNPYQTDLDRMLAEQQTQRQAEAGRDKDVLDAYIKDLEAQYWSQREELLASGERQRSAAQNVYSFSGFGRSTAAADKMAEIQKWTDSAINSLNAAKEAAIAAKRAELAWADSETLAALNDRIQQYQDAALKRQVDAIAKTEEANRAGGASYTEAINNLIKAASDSGINIWDAKNIWEMAQLARNADWSVNEEFITTLPPDLQALIRSAAETSGVSEAPEVKNFGTAKSPDYRQWNGKERVRVAGGARVWAGGGWWLGWGPVWALENQSVEAANRIRNAIQNTNLPLWTVMKLPDVARDLNFLKSNLTLNKFLDVKKAGWTFGAMSEWEWKILADSVGNIWALNSKPVIDRFLTDIITKAWWSVGTPTPQATPQWVPGADASDEDILAFLNS